jgi:hypothetical protein
LIEPKDSDVPLSTDQNNDLRELRAKHYVKGPKNFQKKLDKYTKQHNLPPLQFSEVDDDDTLSGSQPDDIFNKGSQVTQVNLNEDNNILTEGRREKLKDIIDRSKNVGDVTSLCSDLEEFAKEGNLQHSDVICGSRLGGNDHDKENPSSANNEEEEEENLLLTILKIGLVNIMKADPYEANELLKNFKSSGKKQ